MTGDVLPESSVELRLDSLGPFAVGVSEELPTS